MLARHCSRAMKTLVTGGTGLIGNAIVRRLIERGHEVRALVRDPARAKPLLDARAELVRGDVEQPASLQAALQGVEWLFHAAGMPEQWQRDDSVFERVMQRTLAFLREQGLVPR
jgi:uncharacterized protein YbjT (DUF2867 family)